MYLLFALAYLCIDWHIPLLIPASIINNISMSVINSKFSFVFFKQACHAANPGADMKWEGSSPYISIHVSLNFLKTSASNNVSVWTYKSWYSPRVFVSNTSHIFSVITFWI